MVNISVSYVVISSGSGSGSGSDLSVVLMGTTRAWLRHVNSSNMIAVQIGFKEIDGKENVREEKYF